MVHQAANGNWTRCYAYDETSLIELAKKSNRLSQTALQTGATPWPNPILRRARQYDAHAASAADAMGFQRRTERDVAASDQCGAPETTYYVYDAGGQRARKITERQNGGRKNERFYLGGFEVYREYGSGGVGLERETLHVMDDKQCIALVETQTIEGGAVGASAGPAQRYQLANHLGLGEPGSSMKREG